MADMAATAHALKSQLATRDHITRATKVDLLVVISEEDLLQEL